MTIETFTVGCDPEVFLFSRKTGDPVSCHDLLPGTKEKPYRVNKGAIQVDGTAAEFNIEPANDSRTFVVNTVEVMERLQAHITNPDLRIVATPVVKYKPEYFAKLPQSALELGCNPDFNAYTMSENPRPDSSKLVGLETMRTGSGHVHIGWKGNFAESDPELHFQDCVYLVRNLDENLFRFIHLFEPPNERSKLYGAMGCFRPKPFGVEYRTLSNFWLADEALMRVVFELVSGTAKSLCLLKESNKKNLTLKKVTPPNQVERTKAFNASVLSYCRQYRVQVPKKSISEIPLSIRMSLWNHYVNTHGLPLFKLAQVRFSNDEIETAKRKGL